MSESPDELTAVARFEKLYAAGARWDIDEPQPLIREWLREGKFRGRVLDIGCGTGDNALLLASCGYEVVGVDFVAAAIARAQTKLAAYQPPLPKPPRFLVGDALNLDDALGTFDTVLDSGLYHVFPPEARRRYVQAVARRLRPAGWLLLVCFSNRQPGTEGPLRMSESDLREDFTPPWRIERLEPAHYRFRPGPSSPPSVVDDPIHAAAHAWCAEIQWQVNV